MTDVATKQPNPLIALHEQLEQRTSQFQMALPAHIPVERFKRVLLTAVQNNPALALAERRTLWNSAMRAAQDGLLPDGREAAMVIYKTKVKDGNREIWIDAVQYLPMIAGVRKKVRNSGEIATWDVHAVYQKDEFEWELGLEPFLKHKPFLDGDPGPVIAAYSVATLKSGEKSVEVMSKFQIDKVSAASKAKSGPWFDWYPEMCRKTVAKRHSKVLPMSTDLDDLLRRDDELYDLDGASDKNQSPARPKLVDFADMPQNAPMTEDPKKETIDPETGEIGDEADRPEFSAADAYELGQKAHSERKALRAVPPEWRGVPESEPFIDAWEQGWRDADSQPKT